MKKTAILMVFLLTAILSLKAEECTVQITYVVNKTNPVSYSFKSDYTGTGAKFLWKFGDVGTSDNPTPTFTFKTTGTYQIKLTIEANGKVCTGTLTERFEASVNTTVTPVCKIELTAKQVADAANKVQFNCVSPVPMKTYSWTFSDGQKATTKEPSIIFPGPGTYDVTCTASNGEGCTATASIKAVVTVLTYTGKGKVKTSEVSSCGLLIYLESGVILQPVEMVPNFVLKEGQYVEVVYELTNKSTVCMVGKPAKITKIAEIVVPACKAGFTAKKASETDPVLSKKVTFANTSTGTIKELKWSFGDGTTSTQLTSPVEHVYAEFGTYNVCLTIVTTEGCRSEYCSKINLKNPATIPPATCAFEITAKPKAEAPNVIQFNTISAVTLKTWSWTFGDGQVASIKEPLITYKNPGTYEVTCTVTTAEGCTSTRTIKVTVASLVTLPICKEPVVLTLFDPEAGKCNGKAIAKIVDINNNELANAEYQWSTGISGNTAEGLCADKPYNVQVLVKGVCQKGTTFVFQSKPVWRVTSSVGGKVGFTVIDPVSGVNYTWDLGDGNIAYGPSISHEYMNDGAYNVKLTVEGNGNSSVTEQTVTISDKSATFTGSLSKEQFKIYPNPVKDLLRVDFGTETSGNILIEALNLQGKKVLNQQVTVTGHTMLDLDIHNLVPGIYILKLTDGNRITQSQKFVKTE